VKHISYLGGEPFLASCLLEAAAHAKSLGLRTAVVTNGTLLEAELLERIVEQSLFDSIVISIDGPEEIHDQIRGRRHTFKKAATGARLLQQLKKTKKKKRPAFWMYATISALNHQMLWDIFETARRLDANAIRFISASCLTPRDMQASNIALGYEGVTTHSYAVPENMRIPAGRLPAIRCDLKRIEKECRRVGMRFLCEGWLYGQAVKECLFLGREFVVSTQGGLYLCPMLPGLSVGNLKTDSLKEILKSTLLGQQLLRLRYLSHQGLLPVCGGCCVEKLNSLQTTEG